MAPANDEKNIISEIRVLGNKRIERATVISYLKINKGDKYDSDKIDDSLKSLFNTGLFADVNFKSQNDILIITGILFLKVYHCRKNKTIQTCSVLYFTLLYL